MDNREERPSNNKSAIAVVIAIVVIAIIGIGAYLLGANQSKCHGIVGTWTIEGDTMGVYEFKSNGSGGYGMGNFMLPFVYKDNGSYLLISADEGKTWSRTDYKIENFGNNLHYLKKAEERRHISVRSNTFPIYFL